jgi:hypothetical protein
MLKVQKGSKLPKPIRNSTRQPKYPFADLKVNEFFFLEGRETNTMYSYAWLQGQKLKRKFSTRLTYMRTVRGKGWQPAEEGDKGAVIGVAVYRVK